MKSVAIVQPYLFPCIGSFQLATEGDELLSVQGGSSDTPIRNTPLAEYAVFALTKLESGIRHACRRAPCRDAVNGLVREVRGFVAANRSTGLADMLEFSLQRVFDMIIPRCTGVKGQTRILCVCPQIEAGRYVNLPGGRAHYDPCEFTANGIEGIYQARFHPLFTIPDAQIRYRIEHTGRNRQSWIRGSGARSVQL